ncbi:zinc-finger domain-containing protein [Sphingomonas xanthus]|uniref:Zinc-finger domain-containing protein n=1 Tax=Sphingomonas xanthus TaxID=2594473 RepID=A0A516IRH3_9SPHN|nr:zinc-finger domain-containing protein [Sphingomonas xanthus]QDP19507.1 zinc-finger domain-containing protein [Sphingomonas xanthus]
MQPPPELIRVTSTAVVCDGGGAIDPALGHPRVYLRIDEKGYVECGYCDRRFVLEGGPADEASAA